MKRTKNSLLNNTFTSIVLAIFGLIGYYLSLRRYKSSVLFICTGNYYRSRIAEEIFNHYSRQAGLRYKARSKGLAKNIRNIGNFGPMAPYAIENLVAIGIEPIRKNSFPSEISKSDIMNSQHIVALNRVEHENLIETRFPKAAKKVVYWDIPDVNELPPNVATQIIHAKTLDMINVFVKG